MTMNLTTQTSRLCFWFIALKELMKYEIEYMIMSYVTFYKKKDLVS
jgi:hypothetical protein